ncbi:MAG: discoidin domain-containing protein [Microbacterium sp.]|nr:discoidin domain-containing protein [Microbacterium sp.]
MTTSSVESSSYDGAKAVDGNATTRWASVEGLDPQWIRIDLGTGATVSRVVLKWEAAYAKKYRVEISADGSAWTTLATEAAGNGGTDEFTGLSGTGRYLRIYGTARATSYGYSLFEAEVYGTAGSTGNPNPGSGAFSVVAAGDIAGDCGTASSTCNHFATATLAQSLNPAFYMTLGDNQYDDAHLSDFKNYYDKSWGKFKDKTYPIPGNHEKYDSNYDESSDTGDEKGYRDYFGSRATPQGKMWYSYDYGNWHFIALNSNQFQNSEQMNWLTADLAANTKQCTVAYFHEPLFTSGEHGNQLKSKPVWTKLQAAGVELVLSGHDHHYERFNPQTADGTASATGIVEIIGGLGGRDLRDLNDTPQKNSVKRINDRYGVVQIDFTDTTFTTKFVAVGGQVVDTSPTYTCH